MNITSRNKYAKKGFSVVKSDKRIPINYDIKVLDLMCAYTMSENAYIKKSGLINLRNLIHLLDLDLYINDPEKMKRINFMVVNWLAMSSSESVIPTCGVTISLKENRVKRV